MSVTMTIKIAFIRYMCRSNYIINPKEIMIPDIVIAAWSIGLFVVAYIITKKKIDNEK